MEPSGYLFELIKFDMQQIQNYRLAIISISITIVAATFAISAFVYHKDNAFDVKRRTVILMLTNAFMFVILIITSCFYITALDSSRATLELREKSFKQYIDMKTVVDSKTLYPNPEKYKPGMPSWLEKFPIFLAMGLLVVKALIEGAILRANKYAQPNNAADCGQPATSRSSVHNG